MNWLRTFIRRFLRIEDPDIFMAVDGGGYRDYTSVVLIKRLGAGKSAIVEILNFPPGTYYQDVQKGCRALAARYGVTNKNFIQDNPNRFMMDL